MFLDLLTGTYSQSSSSLIPFNGRLWFTLSTTGGGNEVCSLTTAWALSCSDTRPGSSSFVSNLNNSVTTPQGLYFIGLTTNSYNQIFRVNTSNVIEQITNINNEGPTSFGSSISYNENWLTTGSFCAMVIMCIILLKTLKRLDKRRFTI